MIRLSRRHILGLVFSILPLGTATGQQITAIRGAAIIDPKTGAVVPDQTVLIRDSIIVAVGSTSSVQIPRAARIVDATGRFVIPGLWDTHIHLTHWGAAGLQLLIESGVTRVRDMGGDQMKISALKTSVERGTIDGPRMLISGPAIESPALFASLSNPDAPPFLHRLAATTLPGTRDGALAAVDSTARMGPILSRSGRPPTPPPLLHSCRAPGPCTCPLMPTRCLTLDYWRISG